MSDSLLESAGLEKESWTLGPLVEALNRSNPLDYSPFALMRFQLLLDGDPCACDIVAQFDMMPNAHEWTFSSAALVSSDAVSMRDPALMK